MCGIAAIVGRGWKPSELVDMIHSQQHRGPDDSGMYVDTAGLVGLGHNRLSVIDLSPAGHQPMASDDGRLQIVFNGEIYNFLELRSELNDYRYRSQTDTEVILAAYRQWGPACLDRLVGMFAFVLWDDDQQCLFAARDRFGVKPLNYYVRGDGGLVIASEIRSLRAAGISTDSDLTSWATYLTLGLSDHTDRTFWKGIRALPAGHALTWKNFETRRWRWYDLAARVGPDYDRRPIRVVQEEYGALLAKSVRLRFRSDVRVGINLSGGLDSSTLLGLVQTIQGADSDVKAFTFTTGDERYDELPWVRQMLARTCHPLTECRLRSADVPALAESVHAGQDEPYGGIPTLAYAQLFDCARADGVTVLLDGQGMDEQWAGYDYYLSALDGTAVGVVQGIKERPVRPDCLTPEFRAQAEPFEPPKPFPDLLRNVQYRDTLHSKIPRSLRFNDRISMRSSTELREPFLDHTAFELAVRQPPERKIVSGTRKYLLRRLALQLLPDGVAEAPKRPLQTPQREWLRGVLRPWAHGCIEEGLAAYGGTWLDATRVRQEWRAYCEGQGDNSFFVWQWISLGLLSLRRSKTKLQPAEVRTIPSA